MHAPNLGFMEILVLLAGGFSSPTHDLVSLIRAEDYFKSRNIPLEAKEMLKRALTEPDSGKAQIQQLLALRWLGENPAKTGKVEARAGLEAIANGKKAQDKLGFARLYARQALARLDGKPLPVAAPTRPGRLTEAISWFPADTTIVGGVELSPYEETLEVRKNPLVELLSQVPPQVREEIFKVVEDLGNVRLDRMAMGLTVDEKGSIEKIRLRFSGAVDPKRLASLLARGMPRLATQQQKGPKGEPIILLSTPQEAPAFALIGNTELIVAGFEKQQGNHAAVVEEILKVRAGKDKGVLSGTLDTLLKDLPRNSRSFLAANLHAEMRRKLLRDSGPLPSIPQRFLASLTRGDPTDATKAGLKIVFEGSFKDAAEAKNFATVAQGLRQQGLKALENSPPQAPRELVKSAQQALKDLKIERQGQGVRAELQASDESLIQGMLRWFMLAETRRSELVPIQ